MKFKALLLTGLFVLGLVFMVPQNAVAENLWADVTIDRMNQAPNSFSIWFSEVDAGGFKGKMFNIRPGHPHTKEIVAIILTAKSLGEQVRIRFVDGHPAILDVVGLGIRQ